MARNDDRDGIAVVRLSDGAIGSRSSHSFRDFGVAARLAVRNPQQFLPTILLEVRAAQIEQHSELAASPCEVLFQLLPHGGASLIRLLPIDFFPAQPVWQLMPEREYCQAAIRHRKQ